MQRILRFNKERTPVTYFGGAYDAIYSWQTKHRISSLTPSLCPSSLRRYLLPLLQICTSFATLAFNSVLGKTILVLLRIYMAPPRRGGISPPASSHYRGKTWQVILYYFSSTSACLGGSGSLETGRGIRGNVFHCPALCPAIKQKKLDPSLLSVATLRVGVSWSIAHSHDPHNRMEDDTDEHQVEVFEHQLRHRR